MATAKVTYASALNTIIAFATDNGFDNEEVMEKLRKLAAQKATNNGTMGRKSKARRDNEIAARKVRDIMLTKNATDVTAKWVVENYPTALTMPKCIAILNAGDDEGILIKRKVDVSATRSQYLYSPNTDYVESVEN